VQSPTRKRPARAQRERTVTRLRRIAALYESLTLPFSVFFLFADPHFRPRYEMTWRRKVELGWRLYRNTRRIRTGISYKAHLAMAAKLLEMAPDEPGVIVECGCWLGGTTANLSVICDVVGRDLIAYDSFEGLPVPVEGDEVKLGVAGTFRGYLEEVRGNVETYGVIERCEFRKGWFKDTLPNHTEPIALMLIDVDLKSSMHDCLVNLWPHLVEKGYVFFDEYVRLDHCSVFFSERFWRDYLDREPPGLLGTGTGIGVGQYFIGPLAGSPPAPAGQRPSSVAYTRKDFDGGWRYRPVAD
jgi:O-methyltransferase